MSDEDKKQDIEKQIDESRQNQVNDNDSVGYTRDVTKMQAPEEWPDPPKEKNANDGE